MNTSSITFQRAAWKRLKKNKGAIFGLVIIIFAILVAIFAYFIAPDPSPFANRIILEIGGAKPGYTQTFLKVNKVKSIARTSFITQLIEGKEDAYYFVPITNHRPQGDSIIVAKYIDEGLTERQAYLVKDLPSSPVVTQKFLLGTDKFGRDILSRLIIGTRVSLAVGLIAVIISLTIGIFLGVGAF